jgi:pseudaminic acid biosynthesis-associated methylase
LPTFGEQSRQWGGEFGKEYTERNLLALEDFEAMYKMRFGLTRTELNEKFLSGFARSNYILEVGSNVGMQLEILEKMGFRELYGLEVQAYAIGLSSSRQKTNLIQATGLHIPFRASAFDLVFTSGVLIHIDPSDIVQAMKEIHRCSREYIWGFEYYADRYTEVTYRGRSNLLWKADFAKLYLSQFKDLELVKEKRLEYLDNPNNKDSMFLLRKH